MTKLVVVIGVLALTLSACGSPRSVGLEAVGGADVPGVAESEAAASFAVSTVDRCSDELSIDRAANPPREGDGAMLSTWLGLIDGWVELRSNPTIIGRVDGEPYFTMMSFPPVVEVHETVRNTEKERSPGQPLSIPSPVDSVIVPTDVAERLARLEIVEEEGLLVGLGWSDVYREWVAYNSFAFDADRSLWAVGDCVGDLTATTRALTESHDGGRQTAYAFLLSTPFESIETLEFGGIEGADPGGPAPGVFGAASQPLILDIKIEGQTAGLVCVAQGDEEQCLDLLAADGADFSYTVFLDGLEAPVSVSTRVEREGADDIADLLPDVLVPVRSVPIPAEPYELTLTVLVKADLSATAQLRVE